MDAATSSRSTSDLAECKGAMVTPRLTLREATDEENECCTAGKFRTVVSEDRPLAGGSFSTTDPDDLGRLPPRDPSSHRSQHYFVYFHRPLPCGLGALLHPRILS
jgi:hypothetical protein